jgi:hypothetical protein
VAVVGGGPAGLTAALLLARRGHRVTVFEAGAEVGGLWATRLDGAGHYLSENSCKVYQASYHSAPALLRLLGTRWEDHFVQRHDLVRDWLRPFVADASWRDLGRLVAAWLLHRTGLHDHRGVSVADWLDENGVSEACRAWMRATALGGITGTLRMTMGELFHRLDGNVASIFSGRGGALYWNARPPNTADGFVSLWRRELDRLGVRVHCGGAVARVEPSVGGPRVVLADGAVHVADAVFLAVPPRPLARLVEGSPPALSEGFGHAPATLAAIVEASLYEHLGVVWTFDRPLGRPLPLGGRAVRRGWHAIVLEHSQYGAHLPPGAVAAVVGSVSLATNLRHPRLGTFALEHGPDELARILWDDERALDPSLPEPFTTTVHGLSNATQVVAHGTLPVRCAGAPVFLATSLNGAAPYFTASLESAIQAGAAAAVAFDPGAERLPTGSTRVADAPAAVTPSEPAHGAAARTGSTVCVGWHAARGARAGARVFREGVVQRPEQERPREPGEPHGAHLQAVLDHGPTRALVDREGMPAEEARGRRETEGQPDARLVVVHHVAHGSVMPLRADGEGSRHAHRRPRLAGPEAVARGPEAVEQRARRRGRNRHLGAVDVLHPGHRGTVTTTKAGGRGWGAG